MKTHWFGRKFRICVEMISCTKYSADFGGYFIDEKKLDQEACGTADGCNACGARVVLLDCGLSAKCAAVTQEICSRLNTELIDEKEWEILIKSALQEGERGV